MTLDSPIAPIVVSTDTLPERERFDAWRESFALKLVRVDVTTPNRAEFRAAMGMLPLERLSLVACDVGAAIGLRRSEELVRDGNDDISLVICTGGGATARFDEESVTVGPGDAMLVPSGRVGGIVTDTHTTSLSLRLPRALLRDVLGSEPPCLRLIPRHDSRLQMLTAYARALLTAESPLRPATVGLVDRQIIELVAHLLNPAADIARADCFGGVKAARLKTVMAGIEQHLANPNLSAEWLGAKLGLSERYVQHLLAEAGIGFAQLVRRRRLEWARTLLEDHSAQHRRIADIAYAVGFSDLSNFNHAFRQHFGRTPSDIRRGG